MRASVEYMLASLSFRPCNRTANAPALVQFRFPSVLRFPRAESRHSLPERQIAGPPPAVGVVRIASKQIVEHLMPHDL